MAQTDSPKVGRPTKLTDEVLEAAERYADGEWQSLGHMIPSAVGLAKVLGIGKRTIYNWAETSDQFLHILAKVNTEQEFTLLNNGLSGEFNTAITKLVLGKHDYHDSSKTDVTSSDGSIKPTVIELVGVSSESSTEDSK